ncbi:methionine biosynthesis protein MetW [Hydrocarboniclastica marina]|uniref:methionine biosynthesis protein MetW n=1 Tax=Hydrocarboniclastica marina TaxID=2259620 RepID=UPI0026D5BCE6|tara:strand:+ start:4945 stop:5541 length:597 start_codon:yes stop_codon:yes gene_type:complete
MLRPDLDIIEEWIQPGSRVLDLGCGDGTLLDYLQREKRVAGYGLEINPGHIEACVEKGVNVIEQNLDIKGLANFRDNSFDTVVMTQALQAVRHPDMVLEEMLRLGKEGIVTFPNFAYWRLRLYLFWQGRMPMSRSLPHTWYNTPNIHLCTFRDFEALCAEKNIRILDRSVVDTEHRSHFLSRTLPNLLGQIAIYRISR